MTRITTLHFHKPGLQTLVVDQGRTGYQAWGVPVGGAMDRSSAQLANWLVGNLWEAPVLEITLMGPIVKIEGDCQIAITGANLSPKLGQRSLPMYETVTVENAADLSFGKPLSGCRAYLAIGGHWQVPKWLASHSALAYDSTGVTTDSLIKKNTILSVDTNTKIEPRKIPFDQRPEFSHSQKIRVLPGPEFGLFTKPLQNQLVTKSFTLSKDSNRMGCRLNTVLEGYEPETELISSGIVPGTIQVTASGQLVLLMADAQTSGGYPRIANVITSDLDVVGQLKPGDEVSFTLVDLAAAYRLCEEVRKKEVLPNRTK